MSWKATRAAIAALAMAAATETALAQSTNPTPTCSEALEIEVHGQHVVGDYVTGLEHANLEWPPRGGVVGPAIQDNGGIETPGGPGPGFHFEFGIAPGASFCTDSQSPGFPH